MEATPRKVPPVQLTRFGRPPMLGEGQHLASKYAIRGGSFNRRGVVAARIGICGVRVVLQRVISARVVVGGRVIGEIGCGLVALVGFSRGDDEEALRWMADKLPALRIFGDASGRMNLSLDEAAGELLVISQFTLYGDARKGRRPSFTDAAEPALAIPLYERFIELLRSGGRRVETGEFGAHMQVELTNDGPVTLILER